MIPPEPVPTPSNNVATLNNVDLGSNVLEAHVLSPARLTMKTVSSMRFVLRARVDLCVTAMKTVALDTSVRRDSVLLAVQLTVSVARVRLVSTLNVRIPACPPSVDLVQSVLSPTMRPSAPVLQLPLAILSLAVCH